MNLEWDFLRKWQKSKSRVQAKFATVICTLLLFFLSFPKGIPNRDCKLSSGFPTGITKAKVDFRLRARPTFAFFLSFPKGIPNATANTSQKNKNKVSLSSWKTKTVSLSQKNKISYSKKLQAVEKQRVSLSSWKTNS